MNWMRRLRIGRLVVGIGIEPTTPILLEIMTLIRSVMLVVRCFRWKLKQDWFFALWSNGKTWRSERQNWGSIPWRAAWVSHGTAKDLLAHSSSGRIPAFQADDRGSIPLWATFDRQWSNWPHRTITPQNVHNSKCIRDQSTKKSESSVWPHWDLQVVDSSSVLSNMRV